MLSQAVFGISNSGVNLAIDLIILFLVVVWLALVYWTYADARRRIADPMLVGCATAASLFPFVGTLVYVIVRPPEYLDDVRERELEIQAAEARLAELGYHLCPHCDYEVEKDFLRCPNCMRKLRDPCPVCAKPLDPSWRICPFCEADLAKAAPTPRRARRRREGTERPVSDGFPETERPPVTGARVSEGAGGSSGPERRFSEGTGSSSASERRFSEGTGSPATAERSTPPPA